MSEESFVLSKYVYENYLKNKMLCKYLDIVNCYGEGIDSDLAHDLEELIELAKDLGKDIGFKSGVSYTDLLWQDYIEE